MIGLDTNILVRYLAQDDPMQSPQATRLIEKELSERSPGYVSLIVLVETCWVLKRLYGATPVEVVNTARDLLDARQLQIENRRGVTRALARLDAHMGDIADALIAECAIEAGCSRVVTFDKAAVKLGMSLVR